MLNRYEELSAKANAQLSHGGAFLMSGREEKNPTTIGWCQFGRVWNIPVCTVFIRHSRYAHTLLERDGVFTISFPKGDAMKKELGFCGTKSGRDVNKIEALGLQCVQSKTGGVDGLGGCAVHVECKIINKIEMKPFMAALQEDLRTQFYAPQEQAGDDGDPHTVYFAQVLAIYENGEA